MTQHYIESSNSQPQLFVFKRDFLYTQQVDFEDILQQFEDEFALQQQAEWLSYWADSGEEIALHKWKLKYSNYLADGPGAETIDEVTAENPEQIEIRPDVNEDGLLKDTDSWEDLWQRHLQEVYGEQYMLYSTVYYNFFTDLLKSLQTDVNSATAEYIEDNLCPDFVDEFEQLEILGLPTTFGSRQQKKGRKKPHTKQESWTEQQPSSDDDEVDHLDNTAAMSDENTTQTDTICTDEKMDAAVHKTQHKAISKKKKRILRNVPEFLREEKGMLKYWRMRFSLFARFDEGIRLDRESWFSVTPEKVATHLAQRLSCDIMIDAFCGCGGNTIQFAKTCRKVIAIDIDPSKLEMAKHNAKIYGISDKVEFILGDFLQLSRNGKFRGDIVFLSPPWGGPTYKKKATYDIEKFLLPVGASELMESAREVSDNVVLFLPRNSNMQQVIKLAGVGNRCEVEHNYLDTRLVAITALYGEDVLKKPNQK